MAPLLNPPVRGRILLHSCCAPCSGAVLECMVQNGLRPTVFFSNSNIVPREEYELRKSELRRYCDFLGVEAVDDEYDHGAWLSAVRGLENSPERGSRCTECFRFRLLRAARYAAGNGFAVLTTTLASSRWKNLDQVNAAGEWACAELSGAAAGLVFWPMNWRKGGLQPRRGEIIREQNFYNQTWCGCEFSRRVSETEPHSGGKQALGADVHFQETPDASSSEIHADRRQTGAGSRANGAFRVDLEHYAEG